MTYTYQHFIRCFFVVFIGPELPATPSTRLLFKSTHVKDHYKLIQDWVGNRKAPLMYAIAKKLSAGEFAAGLCIFFRES